MSWVGDLVVGLVILVAAVGTLVPVLPGAVMAGAAIVVWAILVGEPSGWVAMTVALLFLAAGQVLKYLLPGRQLSAAGVPGRSIVVGGVLGIVGFFVVPVLGLPLGFLLGVFIAELVRLGTPQAAWPSTLEAMKATGFSIVIEMGSILLAGSAWAAGAALT